MKTIMEPEMSVTSDDCEGNRWLMEEIKQLKQLECEPSSQNAQIRNGCEKEKNLLKKLKTQKKFAPTYNDKITDGFNQEGDEKCELHTVKNEEETTACVQKLAQEQEALRVENVELQPMVAQQEAELSAPEPEAADPEEKLLGLETETKGNEELKDAVIQGLKESVQNESTEMLVRCRKGEKEMEASQTETTTTLGQTFENLNQSVNAIVCLSFFTFIFLPFFGTLLLLHFLSY